MRGVVTSLHRGSEKGGDVIAEGSDVIAERW